MTSPATLKVAVLGANGLVGGRLMEAWRTGSPFHPTAVVRGPGSLARLARFDLPWRLADARDEDALARAFAGCEAVVHCVVGDERVIGATVAPAYRAAARAGVRRLVYLSSASVHGHDPPEGTSEDSPLSDRQPFGYNNAKVRAERRLAALARDGRVETSVLRPGIVYGPRSRWIADVGAALAEGRAGWIGGGRGVCNGIYLDNLVHAIGRALESPEAAGQAFIVGDREETAWRDLYLGVAAAFGMGEEAFSELRPSPPEPGWRRGLGRVRSSPSAQWLLARAPASLKEAVKAALRRPDPGCDPWEPPRRPAPPAATPEMTALFSCRARLGHAKAAGLLGYAPPVAFAEGVRRSGAWIRWVLDGGGP